MERRLLLAVVLMTAAILFTNILFPPPEPPVPVAGDTASVASVAAAPESGRIATPLTGPMTPGGAATDTVTVESPLYRYQLSSRGGTFIGAEMLGFPSYSVEGEPVQLVTANSPGLFINRIQVGDAIIDLRSLPFAVSTPTLQVTDPASVVDFTYADASGFGVSLRYQFRPDSYLIGVTGRVTGLNGREASLLTGLGPSLGLHEHADHHSEQEFAAVTRSEQGIERLLFRKVRGTSSMGTGLSWAAIKDKYFLAAIIAGESSPLAEAAVLDAADGARVVDDEQVVVPQAMLRTRLPIAADGSFSYSAFLGPQDYGLLSDVGYELEEITPYGYRWLQPVIGPLAAAVVWVLNTLHHTLGIAYGWVLAIFGVMMRIVLWPLNARAMRAQMKNMGVQPLLQELKEKYKDDPKKQQEAMLALYKEHGFNPFGGCLPMLAPMPVLITLFFVFQNTIAFRGAEFLWLPDLSLRDPYYILPLILMVSMYGLQYISAHLSGIEQNPQMKMMLYVMPLMMGVLFFMLPSGLNLYYAVTQIASIPQQMLIARERREAQAALKANAPPKLSSLPSGVRRKPKPKR